MNDNDRLRQHLSTALDEILTALVITGGYLGVYTPDTAIDVALGVDPHVGIARQAFLEALRGLRGAQAEDDTPQAVIGLEAAVNALVVASANAAYRLGLRVGRGQRG